MSCSTASTSRRSRRCRGWRSGRSQGGLGGQDLLADRVEDRLDRCVAGECRGRGAGPPVPDLRDRAEPAGGGGLRDGAGRCLDRADAPALFACFDDACARGLQTAGYQVLEPASTYFLCVDLTASGIDVDDETFATTAVERAGVAAVPISAFAEDNPSRHLVRLCFAKRDETIDAGVAAMARARELFA